MAELLVSVRDAEEALAALAGGAAIIDVKEPSRGALGAADPEIWQAVVRAVGGRVPVSVALGEWIDGPRSWDDRIPNDVHQALSGVAFAKLGLAGASSHSDWRSSWVALCRKLSQWVKPVAVLYADWQIAGSPSPQEILASVDEAGCEIVLIDTFRKDGRSLHEVVDATILSDWTAAIRGEGGGAVGGEACSAVRGRLRTLVIAGSLTTTTIPRALTLTPDYVAVRGAACGGDRTSRVCTHHVSQLISLLRGDLLRGDPTTTEAMRPKLSLA
ncbi:MAG: hypothetical protein RIS70_2245 [Planctomycetota bacterium]